jgi:hypothetical protein
LQRPFLKGRWTRAEAVEKPRAYGAFCEWAVKDSNLQPWD